MFITRESHLRASVNHLLLDLRCVRRPRNEDDFVPLAPVIRCEVKVKHAVAAVVGGEAGYKVIVGLALVTEGVDHDLGVVLNLVNEESVVVRGTVQLEGVESLHYSIVHGNSGGLDGWGGTEGGGVSNTFVVTYLRQGC